FLRSVALLVRHQQERYDGLGYPSGMKGEWIPLGARILAVAQAYTELTEGNEASSPLSAQEALARICASRGVRYDPKVIDVLTEILRTRGLIPMSAECRVAPAEV
ncbi:MAG: hypothetical protein GTO55_00440, partial [Armatimonadetes bacterium]|nr:hypothetical protein [Armatimonadota bacterium]NIM23904.1 hypothetical protein [Armatimonadota bacterium]NIM66623.1 hypothetical protein [Armatimonadota bacterium]NIM76291.1 hypothetical protein [Armatimonadota bacterium]NIN05985.1 hypothetical protein [Armatimonadota bacterium]